MVSSGRHPHPCFKGYTPWPYDISIACFKLQGRLRGGGGSFEYDCFATDIIRQLCFSEPRLHDECTEQKHEIQRWPCPRREETATTLPATPSQQSPRMTDDSGTRPHRLLKFSYGARATSPLRAIAGTTSLAPTTRRSLLVHHHTAMTGRIRTVRRTQND